MTATNMCSNFGGKWDSLNLLRVTGVLEYVYAWGSFIIPFMHMHTTHIHDLGKQIFLAPGRRSQLCQTTVKVRYPTHFRLSICDLIIYCCINWHNWLKEYQWAQELQSVCTISIDILEAKS